MPYLSIQRRILLLVLLVLCGSRTSAQDDKLELRLRLKQGETYRLKTTVEQRITGEAGSQQAATDQTFAVGYALTVQNVDGAGNMRIATKYESILFRQKGPTGAIEYDSQNPPKQVPQSARPFAALTGLGFTATMTPAGQIIAVEGLDAMLTEMVNNLELPEGPAKAAVQETLGQQFGEDTMKQNLRGMFALYPETPVAVGESWQRKTAVSKGFPVLIEGVYTLEGRAGGVARVAIKATLSPNDAAGPVDLGTGRMSYDLKGEQSGFAEIDEATGWTRSIAINQLITGTLRFQGAGGVPELTKPVTIHEIVTTTAPTVPPTAAPSK